MNKGDRVYRLVWDTSGYKVEWATYVGSVNDPDCPCLHEVKEIPFHAHEVFNTLEEAEERIKKDDTL